MHEMVHAATNEKHGMPWKREMIRLREAGAPLCATNCEVALDDRTRQCISKDHFRGEIEDILLDAPEITLHRAIRHFIYWEGGPETTIRGFLRRYPWAPKIFQAAKKERVRWQKVWQER